MMTTSNTDVSSPQKANPYISSTEVLSDGLLQIYKPGLTTIENQLKELTDKQEMLLEQIHNENLCLSKVQHSQELQQMFNKVKAYQSKLLNLKKDIKTLHERSTKLKKRALKLQQFKEKEDYLKLQKNVEIKQEDSPM